MSGKKYQTILVVILFNSNILKAFGESDESKEESQSKYEYMQIFKSIPALFEYVLDALEERPEILEKNDVTMFEKNIHGSDNEESENADDESKIDKRDVDCDNINFQTELGNNNNVKKRDANDFKDVAETSAYEYGNSNIIMNGLDELDSDIVSAKRMAKHVEGAELGSKKIINRDMINGRVKRSVLSTLDDDTNDMFRNYGEVFFGFEHLFGLDLKPEEIEERILAVENLLEEHNSKKDKDD